MPKDKFLFKKSRATQYEVCDVYKNGVCIGYLTRIYHPRFSENLSTDESLWQAVIYTSEPGRGGCWIDWTGFKHLRQAKMAFMRDVDTFVAIHSTHSL